MQDTNFIHIHSWRPLAAITQHPFFTLNKETVINTWIALGILVIAVAITRYALSRRSGILRYLLVSFARSFIDLTQQTLGVFHAGHFYFATSLFMFLLVCNCITVLPWTEEPTQDLNTTLAMGISSFVYIQAYAIRAHGFLGYLKEYVTPLFIMFPLHVISKLSSIISLSFRLFGNIFGGAVISRIYLSAIQGSWLFETLGLLSGINFIIVFFFIMFEGALQAFVFAMLSLTYLSIAIAGEEPPMGDLP